jgi:hypothetical protein
LSANLVVQCDDGNISLNSVVQGDFIEVVKKEVNRAVGLWKPTDSDFMVFSTQNEAQLDAPLSKDMLDKVKLYSPARRGDKIVFNLPVYVISYKIQQESQNEYRDRSVIVVAPYINEDLKLQVEQWSKELTTEKLGEEATEKASV